MWSTGGHYNDWVAYLDRWRVGAVAEPADPPRLSPADFTGDTWSRLVDRLTGALAERLRSWAAVLARELGDGADEFTAARALNHARHGLVPILALAGHPALPDDLTTKLLEAVETAVRSAQQSLEASVERLRRSGADRALVEARLRTIRDNALTRPPAADQATDQTPGGRAGPADGRTRPTADPWAADPSSAPRRRVIVD